MPLPSAADQVVIQGVLLDEVTGAGLAGTVTSQPVPLTGQSAEPMVLAADSHAHIQTRPRTATPDPTTGYWAIMALSTNDPDLDAYGGRTITLPGQTARTIEVPWNAPQVTVSTAMAAQINPGNLAGRPVAGDTVRAIWYHQAAGFVAPTPANAYLTSQQTIDLIASAIGSGGGGGGSGSGDLPEYSPSAQTAAVTASGLTGKTTRFNTTSAAIAQSLPAAVAGRQVAVGWDAGTNALTLVADGSDVIGSGSATSIPIPVVNAVVQLHCTTAGRWRVVGGHLPSSYVVFNSVNTDQTGAAPGKVPAVTGVSPLTYGLRTLAELGGGGSGSVSDATTSSKGVARLLGGTADSPTVPAMALTGTIDDAQIPSGIARDAEVTAAVVQAVADLRGGNVPANLDTLLEVVNQLVADETGAASLAATVAQKAPRLTPTVPAKTGPYTAVAGELVLADASAGAVPITIPAAAAGASIAVKKTDSSVNIVTLTFPDASTVDLKLSGETRILLATASTWYVIGGLNTLSSLDSRFQAKLSQQGTWAPGAVSPLGGLWNYLGELFLDTAGGTLPAVPTGSARFTGLSRGPINARDLGIRFDAREVTDGAMTSGSATFTSATAAFTAADVGKLVTVPGAGVSAAMLLATISSITNGSTAVLSAPAQATVSARDCLIGTNDDAAWAAALAAVPNGATIQLPLGNSLTTVPLSLGKHVTFAGMGAHEHWGSVAAFLFSLNVPPNPPYVSGSVITQCGAGQHSMIQNAAGLTVHARDFALRFAPGIAFVNTGHGIYSKYGTPPLGGSENGIMGAHWENLICFGTDGNHYAWYVVNPILCTWQQLRSYGGGGPYIECDSYYGNYGNLQADNVYAALLAGGSAHAWNLVGRTGGSVGKLNLIQLNRPQGITLAGGSSFGAAAALASQKMFQCDDNNGGISILQGDFETAIGSGFRVSGANGTFIDPGTLFGSFSSTYFPVYRRYGSNKIMMMDGQWSGTGPSAATATMQAGAGTSPPAPVVTQGDDMRGQVTFGTGTSPAAGDQIKVNWSAGKGTSFIPVITAANAATAALMPYIASRSTTGFIVGFANPPAASQPNTAYGFTYYSPGG